MSRVAVIGAGYVGLTTAACLADLGNNVVVVDIDEKKIGELQRNRVPFYEPGINELVERNARARRLRFTTSYFDAIPGADVTHHHHLVGEVMFFKRGQQTADVGAIRQRC